jgi:hypothetical protein
MSRFDVRSCLGLVLLVSTGCSGIVGGRCEQGYSPCDGRCVVLVSDPSNCGACGNVCALGAACVAGACASAGDGSVGDGAAWPPDAWLGDRDGAAPDAWSAVDAWSDVDGGTPDASASDVDASSDSEAGAPRDATTTSPDGGLVDVDAWTDPDGGVPACDVGELLCDGVCVRVGADPMHCGACGVACAADEVCSAGVCEMTCPPGTAMCSGGCVDLTSDPDHCGACGVACPTGICVDSTCVAPYAGHLVVVGHDYEVHRAAMDGVLAHSVFLTVVATPLVLRYVGTARSASVAGIDAALASAAPRPFTMHDAATPGDITVGLADADVLLVYPQHDATTDDLVALGATCGRAISTFLARGGVVVVADGLGELDIGGAATWLGAAGLFTASGREDATLSIVQVRDAADAIAVRLPLSYRAEPSTVRYLDPSLPVVYGDDRGGVVLHRTVVP